MSPTPRTLRDYAKHDSVCLKGSPKLECPSCGGLLDIVRQGANSMLNSYQFDAVKAGDYYCAVCKGNEAERSTYKYWWARELSVHECSCGLDALLAADEPPPNSPTNVQDTEEQVYHAYEAARRLRLKHIVDYVDFDVVIAGLCAARRFIFYSYSLPAQNETNWAGRKELKDGDTTHR